MRKIMLTLDKVALVDDADYAMVSQFKWSTLKTRGGRWYAVRCLWLENKQRYIYMHRFILGTPPGMDTDHEDGNGLNNQRYNLRAATKSQNHANAKIGSFDGKSSRYKGVSWHKRAHRWRAQVYCKYSTIYLGLFDSEESAALAYNKRAMQVFGDFARLNVIEWNIL